MAFDTIPYTLNSGRDISPGVNGLSLNPDARCADVVEQAYAFFSELGPYAADLGPKMRTAKTGGTAWRPNPTIAGFGVRLAGATGYYAAPGHQLRPWSRECLFVYGASGEQAISLIIEAPGGGANDRWLYVNASSQIVGGTYDGGAKLAIGTTTLVVGQVYHVVVTASNSLLSVYLNGVLEATVAVANAGYQSYTTPELVFGYGTTTPTAPTANTLFWSIEYNRVLTADDVRHRYLNQMEMFRLADDPLVGVAAGGDTVLAPSDMTGGQALETPGFSQTHNLSAAKEVCAFGFETPAISQNHNFTAADVFISESIETPVLTPGGQLSPAKSFFAAVFETPAFFQIHNLAVADETFLEGYETAGFSQAHLFSAQEMHSAFLFDPALLVMNAQNAPAFRSSGAANNARRKNAARDERNAQVTAGSRTNSITE